MQVPKKILDKFPKLSKEILLNNLSLPSGKNKMILDTDTANEIDDQFALAWTLLSTICFPRFSNCLISAPFSDKAPSIL